MVALNVHLSAIRRRLPIEVFWAVQKVVLEVLQGTGLLLGRALAIDASTMEANAALRSIVRRDTNESDASYVAGLAKTAGEPDPVRSARARFDRKRPKRTISNQDWESPADPDAKIAKLKDGRTALAYKPEHVVDLDTGAIVAATVQSADLSDHATSTETLVQAIGYLEHLGQSSKDFLVVADQGYHSEAVIAGCVAAEIESCISEPKLRGSRRLSRKPLLAAPTSWIEPRRGAPALLVALGVHRQLDGGVAFDSARSAALGRRLRRGGVGDVGAGAVDAVRALVVDGVDVLEAGLGDAAVLSFRSSVASPSATLSRRFVGSGSCRSVLMSVPASEGPRTKVEAAGRDRDRGSRLGLPPDVPPRRAAQAGARAFAEPATRGALLRIHPATRRRFRPHSRESVPKEDAPSGGSSWNRLSILDARVEASARTGWVSGQPPLRFTPDFRGYGWARAVGLTGKPPSSIHSAHGLARKLDLAAQGRQVRDAFRGLAGRRRPSLSRGQRRLRYRTALG